MAIKKRDREQVVAIIRDLLRPTDGEVTVTRLWFSKGLLMVNYLTDEGMLGNGLSRFFGNGKTQYETVGYDVADILAEKRARYGEGVIRCH